MAADMPEWDGQTRCYLPEMHAAESQVASCLARMAASPPQRIQGGEQRVRNWLSRLRQEQGTFMFLLPHPLHQRL